MCIRQQPHILFSPSHYTSFILIKEFLLILLIAASLQGCTDTNTGVEQSKDTPIYKREREFTFLASHFSEQGEKILLDTLVLTTSSKVFSKEYGQTRSSWAGTGENRQKSYSGIEESDTAVWIHPPRMGMYIKLELSPFPMVRYPLEAGSKWSWSLQVGNHYSVDGYAEWADGTNEEFVSNYKIIGKVPLATNLGVLTCYEVHSFTKSNFKQTELKAFYSEDFGFVKLEYLNIDQGRITMELINVKSVQAELKNPAPELRQQVSNYIQPKLK